MIPVTSISPQAALDNGHDEFAAWIVLTVCIRRCLSDFLRPVQEYSMTIVLTPYWSAADGAQRLRVESQRKSYRQTLNLVSLSTCHV